MKARVVIVGAPGYSGAELASILLGHPGAEIVGLFGSAKREDASETFDRVFPRFRNRLTLPVMAASVPEIVKLRPDAVFLCTPHEASVELATRWLDFQRTARNGSNRACTALGPHALFVPRVYWHKSAGPRSVAPL